ncbi:MAG: serine hydrolase [Gammaproteobacteria bacterium CG11_big_fil_rev_8_21_14_0_20_46_22]|nr:MAG: serine hydrolase [Gammaproteobacteria bacterium CG12_big_fil_rev_8_21_14_0_65_46_12]PIR11549.1 MAG: serine hydrolase [Gammaproteobacteria bacterium CG11_big_fil_rev_8_21_14_0_20_46_22]
MTIKIVSPESAGLCSSRLSRINNLMQEKVDQGEFSGISTLVARQGKVVHFEQFGYSDRESKAPMQDDTLFRIYSMTKPIVCAALMTLYEQGKFDLNEPVSKYIPAFARLKVLEKDAAGKEKLVDLAQPVTIWHLLTHTSGLVYDFYDDFPSCQMYREKQVSAKRAGVSLEQYIDRICEIPLAFQPGSRWFYSVSIDVVGRLVEIIANKSLPEYLSETIFKPLGMKDTGFYLPEEKHSRLATMYGRENLFAPHIGWSDLMSAWENKPLAHMDMTESYPADDPVFCRGGSGLFSSAEDYFRFTQMLLNKGELDGVRILSPKVLELMHMNHLPKSLLPIAFSTFEIPGYGFGLGSRVLIDLAKSQLPGSIGEYGWAGAAKTYYWIDPKEELIGLFLTQSLCDYSMTVQTFQTLVYQALIDLKG